MHEFRRVPPRSPVRGESLSAGDCRCKHLSYHRIFCFIVISLGHSAAYRHLVSIALWRYVPIATPRRETVFSNIEYSRPSTPGRFRDGTPSQPMHIYLLRSREHSFVRDPPLFGPFRSFLVVTILVVSPVEAFDHPFESAFLPSTPFPFLSGVCPRLLIVTLELLPVQIRSNLSPSFLTGPVVSSLRLSKLYPGDMFIDSFSSYVPSVPRQISQPCFSWILRFSTAPPIGWPSVLQGG